MKKIRLSKRLKKVSEYVKKFGTLADIGSDHAQLPIYLIQNKFVSKAIAGEVAKGPFQIAKNEVDSHALADKISVRFGNGLEILNPQEEVETITICGMGGLLIGNILKKGMMKKTLSNNTRLVLQPNNAEKELRTLLDKSNYEIIAEDLIEENHKIYEIIVAEHSTKNIQYTDFERTFGPLLLKEKSATFQKKWNAELKTNEYIIEQLKNSKDKEKMKAIQKNIDQIKKVLS